MITPIAIAMLCAQTFGAAEPAGGPLLIVAPRRFHDALAPYAAHKRAQVPTRIAALEDALAAGAGVDDPEKLKKYLYDDWKKEGTRYVLLVGDADVLPVRYMVLDRVTPPAFDYAFYPCDLYYADLARTDGTFDDWNSARDGFHAGYFGEVRGEKNKDDPINFDKVDYRPDIALGRWPVSTPEDVATVVAKSIAFETSSTGKTAAFIASGGWVENRPAMDAMSGAMPPGWKIEKRYWGDGKQPPDEAEVLGLLNAGAALVIHSGHGADDRWEGAISVRSIARMSNAAHPAVMMSIGCSTARFATLPPYEAYLDAAGAEHTGTNAGEVFTAPPPPPAPYQTGRFNPTGLGEQLLRAGPSGAAAYIGCNTGSQPCGMTLAEGFVAALAKKKDGPARVGDCWAQAVSYYYDHQHLATLKPNADWYPPSIFFQGMKFMLFGDPSLQIRGGE